MGIVKIGGLISKPFQEFLGVREGGAESPHLFALYVADLRQKLVNEHPRLCRMAHMIVGILLYADDAALPADTVADLQLS
eukprot:1208590-Karenia_brevis.AAC.1